MIWIWDVYFDFSKKSKSLVKIVKLRANRQKTKDKLVPEIGFVMA